jgi:putative ABC transport system permease protein
VEDYKLGLRMLAKYPGLSIAGSLALAIAIGIGAGWYDMSREMLRPTMPFPQGDRLVEIEMRNAAGGGDERRLLHDFLLWRQSLRSVEDLGAYRTLERNLIIDGSAPQPITTAEITASAFTVTRVPPLLGRALIEADEHPGAPPVAVLGYQVWQRQFNGRGDIIGQSVQLGRTSATVVGVMPDGYAFPINHRLWMPLQISPAGNAALEGPSVRIFARLADGATQAQANAEVTTLTEALAASSPRTHEHLRPRVLAYGGESPGDRSLLEIIVTHLPIILVLVVACATVGTLVYARTAMRDAEIAMRYALGASRARIVFQLFVEALVLTSLSAVLGLTAANALIKWGIEAFYSGDSGGPPFWLNPGLEMRTVIYAVVLTIVGAAIIGALPAIKATGLHVQAQIRNLGSGGSTLRFGRVWTTALIGQVALTVICIPPAMGISEEAIRDRWIRARFPAERYLAVRLDLDRDAAGAAGEPETAFAARFARVYGELARLVAQEPAVQASTFADRLPGMNSAVRRAEFEASPGHAPLAIPDLWTSAIGPGFFEAFDVPLVAGRDFHEGDRTPEARTVLVNEAFARRFSNGSNPLGKRVRFGSSNQEKPEPWFEIVGVVRDIGMQPTDLGEAPYLFRAATPATARPLVMAVRAATDPSALTPRIRSIAAGVDPGLRIDDIRTLDDLVWREDLTLILAASAIGFVVALGLFMSAAAIFSLMSVSVSRRTREIGIRSALGATRLRVLAGVFSRAVLLIGGGVAAGNGFLLLLVALSSEIDLADVASALMITSGVMLIVGVLACFEPARRALRIEPVHALKVI